MLSAIQLVSHQFAKIELYPSDHPSPDGDITGSHTLSIKKAETEKNVWLAKLEVTLKHEDKEKPAPYEGCFLVVGKFQIHPDFQEESKEQMVIMNSGAILYGAVRELILNLTSRSIHGVTHIPTIDARSFLPPKDKSEDSTNG